jgi:hypothetical protein
MPQGPLPDPFRWGNLQREIGATLYRGVVEERHQQINAFSGRMTFDDLQRVIGLDDVVADGLPVPVGAAVVEQVNGVSMALADAPADYKLENLAVDIDDGRIQVRPTYVVRPG